MKRTKRILSFILATAMLLSASMIVSAASITANGGIGSTVVSYGMDEGFTITIPASITIDSSTNNGSAEITASNVMISSGKTLIVKINGNTNGSDWELTDEAASANKLAYNIGSSVGENDIVNNSVVLDIRAGTAYNSDVTKTLYLSLKDELTTSGSYTDTLTFTAEVMGTIKVLNHSSGADNSYSGQTKTFDGVKIDTTSNAGGYPGFGGLKGTYTNCVISGTLALYSDSTFVDCVFIISGDKYNLWTWGAKNVTFENCTFICDGKAVLVYGSVQDATYTFDNCKFYDVGNYDVTKAAIEVGDDYGASYNVVINNISVSGFAPNDKNALYENIVGNKNSMTQEKLNVIIDEVDVY